MNTDLWEESVDDCDEGNDTDRNTTLLPFSCSVAGCIDDVGCENNTSGSYRWFKSIFGWHVHETRAMDMPTRKSKSNSLDGKHRGDEHMRLLVRSFKIDLFTTTPRNHAGEFQPDAESSHGQ